MRQKKLLLKAENFDECDIISSLLQDSIFHISFHFFNKEKNRFHLMLNRFCWEYVDSFDVNGSCYRVHTGLYVHYVDSIFTNGAMTDGQYLSLLTCHTSKNEINLIFSENKQICICVSKILIYLKDLHDRYPTLSIPNHNNSYSYTE